MLRETAVVRLQPAPGHVAYPEPLHELLKVVALRQLELAADEVGHGDRTVRGGAGVWGTGVLGSACRNRF